MENNHQVRTQEVLSVEQVPFEQIENSLGIPREVFFRHPQYEDIVFALTHLVCDHSQITPLIETREYTQEKFKFSAAWFMLNKNDKQQLVVKYIPQSNQVRFENEYNFDNKEIDQLYQDRLLSKEIDLRHDGQIIDCLIQLLPGTNQFLVVPKFSIDIPKNLGQVNQTPENIEKLKNGEGIVITRDGQSFDVKLCLYSPHMITVAENFDRLINQDREQLPVEKKAPSVFSTENTEREKQQSIDTETTPTRIKR